MKKKSVVANTSPKMKQLLVNSVVWSKNVSASKKKKISWKLKRIYSTKSERKC